MQTMVSTPEERRLPRFDEVNKPMQGGLSQSLIDAEKDSYMEERSAELNYPQKQHTKKCGRCTRTLCLSAFAKNTAKKDGLQERCRECRADHYQTTGYVQTARKNTLRNKYNLTPEMLGEMRKTQSNLCAICGIDGLATLLVVDHDHKTGEVRGLLCQPCNRGLGFFRDNEDALLTASDYVRKGGFYGE